MLDILPQIEDQEQPSKNVFPSNQSTRSFTQAWILFAQKIYIHVGEKEHFQEKKITLLLFKKRERERERERESNNNIII